MLSGEVICLPNLGLSPKVHGNQRGGLLRLKVAWHLGFCTSRMVQVEQPPLECGTVRWAQGDRPIQQTGTARAAQSGDCSETQPDRPHIRRCRSTGICEDAPPAQHTQRRAQPQRHSKRGTVGESQFEGLWHRQKRTTSEVQPQSQAGQRDWTSLAESSSNRGGWRLLISGTRLPLPPPPPLPALQAHLVTKGQ